jgi:predicted MPP superfamily phosphohydrolase
MFAPPRRFAFHRLFVVGLLFLVLTSVAVAWAAPAKTTVNQADEVVAIGDVHGAFDDFVAILQRAGLIDKQNHWAGGKAVFVQCGDLIDRGPKPRQVMELMMALEKEAPAAGGRVVGLLGNHEVMNMMGDLRYVTVENYASFADAGSADRQKAGFQQYMKWRSDHKKLLAELQQPMEMTEAEWMTRHPQGFIEHADAFSPNGTYGSWIRQHAALAEIDEVIFLHGGIDPSLAHLKIDTINGHVRDEIKAFDDAKKYLVDKNVILPFFNLQEMTNVVQAEISAERKSQVAPDPQGQARMVQFLGYGEWLSVRVDGPLWFRGYDKWTDDEGMAQIGKVLEAYDAAHVVVGHTVQKGGTIRPRFDNRVFLIDTGMLSSYYPGGRASALEICGDTRFTAEYVDQQVVIIPPATAASPQNGAAAGQSTPAAMPSGGICAAAAAGK